LVAAKAGVTARHIAAVAKSSFFMRALPRHFESRRDYKAVAAAAKARF
jgi:hypothetical protein